MSTRDAQREKRYDEILETALDQFIRRGYAGTKIKDIADAAGMSVGLLFHYFDSKEALYLELIRQGVEAPREMLRCFPAEPPMAFFESCAEGLLYFARRSPYTAKMFVLTNDASDCHGIPEAARQLVDSLNFYDEMVPLIEEGQRDGSIRPGEPLALAVAFWTALQGVIEVHARNAQLPMPNPEWIVDILRAKPEQVQADEI